MRPAGFDKKAYNRRAMLLTLLLVVAASYFYEWLVGRAGVLWPVVAVVASLLVIVLSKWKRFLLILTFQLLGALALMGLARHIIIGKPVLLGIVCLVISLAALGVLTHNRKVNWLLKSDRTAGRIALQTLGLKQKVKKSPDLGGHPKPANDGHLKTGQR